jgi:hypothetical protein
VIRRAQKVLFWLFWEDKDFHIQNKRTRKLRKVTGAQGLALGWEENTDKKA